MRNHLPRLESNEYFDKSINQSKKLKSTTFNLTKLTKTSKTALKLSALSKKLTIRKRLEKIREKVRVENKALKVEKNNRKLKRIVGGWTLTNEQIQYLSITEYKYNASAGSILEVLVMQKFWTMLAKLVPNSVAPCTITAIGFLINLITCSVMIIHSSDAQEEVPKWAILFCALGIWLYQIADALDGKQCYKVQNSQLEEFYDHGADSISTILLTFSVGITIQAGSYPPLFVMVIFFSLLAFYSTHWLNYVTDQMVFGKIDVTEAQITMIFIHLISAMFGQSIWKYPLVTFGNIPFSLGIILMLTTLITLTNTIANNAAIILFHVQTPLEKAGIIIERRYYNYRTIKPIYPTLFLSTLIIYCYVRGYYHLYPAIFILAFGLNFAKLTMKLVIAHCTNHEIDFFDLTLVAPIMLTLNDCLHTTPLVSHDKALLGAFVWNIVELISYFIFVSWDIRFALDVNIFSIKYPPEHPKSRLQTGGYYINGLNNDEIIKKRIN